MSKLLEDLRFFIGSFFFILGLVLVIEGWAHAVMTGGFNLNQLTGSVFLFFSAAMLVLALRASRK